MQAAEGDPTIDAHEARVERYYDFIYHWTQLTNRFRAFARPGAYAIHRGMVDPATGDFSTDTLHRVIAGHLPASRSFKGLDAGCGYAGTMIELRNLVGGSWHGITISRRQLQVACRNIERLGLQDKIEVSLASFDRPLGQSGYDVVLGVESLIHSIDPGRTIRHLAATLKVGGSLVIVDDMPLANVPEHLQPDLQSFKRFWRCPVAPSQQDWSDLLMRAGCDIEDIRDLTDLTRPRSHADSEIALRQVARSRAWRDRLGLKLVSDAQEGGLNLERLTREGAVKYTMIVARKLRPSDG